MHLIADFLLQTGANQPAGKNNIGPARDTAEYPERDHFARIYAQQQQRNKAAKPEPMRDSVAAPEQRSNSVASKKEEPSRNTTAATKSSKPENTSSSVDERGNKAAAEPEQQQDGERQENVVATGKNLPQSDKAEDVTDADPIGGLLDPLLAQIMRATDSYAVDDTADEQLAAEVAMVQQMGVVSLDIEEQMPVLPKSVADMLMTRLHSAETSAKPVGSVALNTLNLDAEEELELDVEPETELAMEADMAELETLQPQHNASQLQQGVAAVRSENLTQTKSEQGEIKAATGAEAKSAPLSRAEQLQSSSAVRTVPGAPVAMQQQGWSKEVTDRVMWMSSQNLKEAEIKLNPAELGRLEVKVSIVNEQTQVSFTSPHAGVRESLESQAFRLREMLAQQGMQNVDVNVSDQSAQDQQQQRELRELQAAAGTAARQDDVEVSVTELPASAHNHEGMHSYYV